MQISDFQKRREEFFKWRPLRRLSGNTLKNYRTDLNCFHQFLTDGKNHRDFGRLDAAYIKSYGHYLQGRYKNANSHRRRVQSLRIFFDFLVEKRVFASNLVRELPTSPKFLDVPRPTPNKAIAKLWGHLSQEAEQSDPLLGLLAKRNRIIAFLIYCGGLKVSDLARLKRDHLFVTLRKGASSRVMLSPPRRDPYSVPLPRVFVPIFRDYEQSLKREKRRLRLSFDDALFSANAHRILAGGIGPRGVEVVFQEISKRLKIPLTPKNLRQAGILRWLAHGEKDSQVREWMGVTPGHDLKPYKKCLTNYPFNDSFLSLA